MPGRTAKAGLQFFRGVSTAQGKQARRDPSLNTSLLLLILCLWVPKALLREAVASLCSRRSNTELTVA